MFGTASRGRNGLRGPTGILLGRGGQRGCELRVKPTEDRVKGESETGERPRPWEERRPTAQGTGKARPKRQGTTSSRRGFALVDRSSSRCTGWETSEACASRRRAASQSRRLPDPNVECVPRGNGKMRDVDVDGCGCGLVVDAHASQCAARSRWATVRVDAAAGETKER
ncbi:hypothetical protein PVAR5_8825 [Paecilomyces variotii No. 5]|uniref:Uncharacterized protein n=1 Tax=Byssochlamys spectabilis (strain No. 5 / NBRC 109023) TaxID=1356009 RepID=V5FPV2_BYSSN|nr:hypothetical protein PVAR5_8825 [Paecilomyces variotii No. 5]